MLCGIYKITNQTNGKSYIGQSKNIEVRWKNHKTDSNNPNGDNYDYPLYRAFRKYGLENFTFEVLEECSTSLLNEREEYYINKYNTLYQGYNQVKVNQGGTKLTPRQVLDIIEELKTNTTENTEQIGAKYNVSGRIIRGINTGEYWYDETLTYPIRARYVSAKSNGSHLWICKECGKEITKGSTLCVDCGHIAQRKTIRPTREELKKLIRTTSFTQIAQQYGVSDNAIRKWCDAERLPRKKSEIKNYSDEEWNLL